MREKGVEIVGYRSNVPGKMFGIYRIKMISLGGTIIPETCF